MIVIRKIIVKVIINKLMEKLTINQVNTTLKNFLMMMQVIKKVRLILIKKLKRLNKKIKLLKSMYLIVH